MKPWERRLKDLAQLLVSCAETYFAPDRFRMSTNQFLQTARTITFIIQKNKSLIPDYETWYAENVITAWKLDKIMQWAKESRNRIEKEGDLDLNSSLHITLMFSYLEEDDVIVSTGREELLNAGIKKLIRLAQKKLPTGVADAAVVKIERRWVTASIPAWELLHALGYIYARMYQCCQSLAIHLGDVIDKQIPPSTSFEYMRENARQVRYIKFHDFKIHHLESRYLAREPDFTPPPSFRAVGEQIRTNPSPPSSLFETVQFFSLIAKVTFEHHGNHQPMLLLFDETWTPIDMLSTQFADQADKFIFWRTVAERVTTLNAFGLIWLAESWVREPDPTGVAPIRNMPIVGERLSVIGIDRIGDSEEVEWKILRADDQELPSLLEVSADESFKGRATPYFLVPTMRAMGIPDAKFLRRKVVD